jgi:hypothetical protein
MLKAALGYLVLVVIAAPAASQDTLAITADSIAIVHGARVRAIAFIDDCWHPQRTIGPFNGLSGGAIRIGQNSVSGETAIPLRSIRSLSVSVGRSRDSGVRRGAIFGGLAGAAVGYFLVPKTVRIERQPVETNSPIHALFGAAIGAAVGAGIGSLFPSDRWQPVSLPAGVTFSPECPSPQPVAR